MVADVGPKWNARLRLYLPQWFTACRIRKQHHPLHPQRPPRLHSRHDQRKRQRRQLHGLSFLTANSFPPPFSFPSLTKVLNPASQDGSLGSGDATRRPPKDCNAFSSAHHLSRKPEPLPAAVIRTLADSLRESTIQVSVWVKADAGTTAQAMLWAPRRTVGNGITTSLSTPGTSWQQLTLTFTADSTNAIRIHLYYAAGSGTIYYDDVLVQQIHVAPAAALPTCSPAKNVTANQGWMILARGISRRH